MASPSVYISVEPGDLWCAREMTVRWGIDSMDLKLLYIPLWTPATPWGTRYFTARVERSESGGNDIPVVPPHSFALGSSNSPLVQLRGSAASLAFRSACEKGRLAVMASGKLQS